jgi:hypothetical protein
MLDKPSGVCEKCSAGPLARGASIKLGIYKCFGSPDEYSYVGEDQKAAIDCRQGQSLAFEGWLPPDPLIPYSALESSTRPPQQGQAAVLVNLNIAERLAYHLGTRYSDTCASVSQGIARQHLPDELQRHLSSLWHLTVPGGCHVPLITHSQSDVRKIRLSQQLQAVIADCEMVFDGYACPLIQFAICLGTPLIR